MRTIGLALAALALGTATAAAPAAAEPFRFVALGDMPYGPKDAVYPPFEALINRVNALDPAFTIHVGDIKAGGGLCDDALLAEQLAFMSRFQSALVYTPGDNEWTDCHREAAGGFDPIERLDQIRQMFFPGPKSLGQAPIALERQSEVFEAYAPYVENARFTQDGVAFVTVHVVGSNNNFEPRDPKAVQEFFARDKANVAWTVDSLAKAKAEGAKAAVIAIHADVFDAKTYYADFPRHSGHAAWVKAFVDAAKDFGRPVLLIHGDSHVFRIDRPFKDDRRTVENIVRLEVFGAQEMHAVEVSVDPDSPDPFAFRPILNPYLAK